MVSVFYCSWFLVFLDAAIVYSGNPPNVWTTIIAAWLAKMEPIWHCLLMNRTIKRILTKNGQMIAQVAPAPCNHAGPTGKRSAQTNFTNAAVSKGQIANNVKTLYVAKAQPSSKWL